jgi:hypothetical protein
MSVEICTIADEVLYMPKINSCAVNDFRWNFNARLHLQMQL